MCRSWVAKSNSRRLCRLSWILAAGFRRDFHRHWSQGFLERWGRVHRKLSTVDVVLLLLVRHLLWTAVWLRLGLQCYLLIYKGTWKYLAGNQVVLQLQRGKLTAVGVASLKTFQHWKLTYDFKTEPDLFPQPDRWAQLGCIHFWFKRWQHGSNPTSELNNKPTSDPRHRTLQIVQSYDEPDRWRTKADRYSVLIFKPVVANGRQTRVYRFVFEVKKSAGFRVKRRRHDAR